MNTTSKMSAVAALLLAAVLASNASADFRARGASAVRGDEGVAGRQAGAFGDGSGNAGGGYRSGFDAGKASGQRSGYFKRNADGTASAGRNATATNKETGVTYTGSTTWEKGSGISREASCKDASGNTVTCGGSR